VRKRMRGNVEIRQGKTEEQVNKLEVGDNNRLEKRN
jgi:hypothetical protein